MKAKLTLYNREDDKVIERVLGWEEEVQIFNKISKEIDYVYVQDLSVYDHQIIIDDKYFYIINMLSKRNFD